MIHLYIKESPEKDSETAHALLHRALGQEYGIDCPKLELGPYGKPFLPGGPEFNISHSRGYVAVAISDQPVGLDMELVRSYHEKLPERIFSPGELEWFQRRGRTRVDFFTLWTLKESYYKYLGTGLPGFPNETDFRKEGKWIMGGSGLSFTILEEKSLLLAVCCREQMEIRLHRM